MSQNDHSIANQGGASFRADLNNALQALASQNSGTSAPGTTYPNQMWPDDTNNLLKIRNKSNTAWITVGEWDGSTWVPFRDGSATGTAATKNAINDLTAETSIATDDELWVYDTDAEAYRKATVQDVVRRPVHVAAEAASGQNNVAFEDIPAWATRITITFEGVSPSGTATMTVEVGDSGGFEQSGYEGVINVNGSRSNLSSGFDVTGSAAAGTTIHGSVTLELHDASNNTWVAAGGAGFSNTNASTTVRGSKSLSAALDRIRLNVTSGTFDAGTVAINYS